MNKYIHDQKGIMKNDSLRIGRYTIVKLCDDKGREGVGISKLSKLDVDRPEIGMSIARGRAEKSLSLVRRNRKSQHVYIG